jgi:hypothetical protein
MKDQMFARAMFVDREAAARLARLAAVEGRSGCRQMAILLERIARLLATKPQSLVALGLVSDAAADAFRPSSTAA